MKKQIILISIVTLLLLSACDVQLNIIRGSGEVVTEDRPVEGINSVTLATLGDMTIELGDQEELIIEAEENLLPYLESGVRNGNLTIRTRPGINLSPNEPVRYFLTVNSLEGLAISSSGNIDAPALTADSFSAEISSSGDLHLAGLEANNLRVQISSSGDITIDAGEVADQAITISSSGNYEAGDLLSETAEVEISSNGSATIWVTDMLDATISSSGDINYYGNPEISQSITSSGNLESQGEK